MIPPALVQITVQLGITGEVVKRRCQVRIHLGSTSITMGYIAISLRAHEIRKLVSGTCVSRPRLETGTYYYPRTFRAEPIFADAVTINKQLR